jgi:DNA end-binding protein Ku
LAESLIAKRSAKLDMSKFEDGYEIALRELVNAKVNHLPVPKDKVSQTSGGKVINLMDALRKSLGGAEATVGKATKKPVASAKPEAKKGIGLVKPSNKTITKRKSA